MPYFIFMSFPLCAVYCHPLERCGALQNLTIRAIPVRLPGNIFKMFDFFSLLYLHTFNYLLGKEESPVNSMRWIDGSLST